jgi:hypothetical protein
MHNGETSDEGVKVWEKEIFEKKLKDFNDDDTNLLKVSYMS